MSDGCPDRAGWELGRSEWGAFMNMTSAGDRVGKRDPNPGEPGKQIRLTWVSLDVWSALKTAVLMGIASGILAALAALAAWTVLTQAGVFTQADTVLSGFTTAGGLRSVSALLNGDHLGAVCAGVGLATMLGCTVLGVLGALAYNIAAIGSAGALRVGFRTPISVTQAPSRGTPERNQSPS